jgi:hypothetical protein
VVRPLFARGADPFEVTGRLLADGVGDGLPVVPPTEAGLAEMLAGQAEPDAVLGLVPPLFGELTAASAGYFALVAGCRPVELPVVVAAARAALEPEFNLLGVQTTTGSPAVAVVIHGPAVAELGFNPGANALGPGNRVNACVGRAVALTLAGVGGAEPGITDMATLGQPGRYTFCLPEHPEHGHAEHGYAEHGHAEHGHAEHGHAEHGHPESPESTVGWPSLATRRGFEPGVAAVTVLAVGGTCEVVPSAGGATLDDILEPIAAQLAGATLAGGDTFWMAGGEQSVVLPPEVCRRLTTLGATAEAISVELYSRGNSALARAGAGAHRVAAGPESVYSLVSGGVGVKMLHLPGWMGGSRAVTAVIT